MNPLSFILTVLGCILIALGIYGSCTHTMDALAIHSCNSEGALIILFAMVFQLVTEGK
jgi:hypothetical protein